MIGGNKREDTVGESNLIVFQNEYHNPYSTAIKFQEVLIPFMLN